MCRVTWPDNAALPPDMAVKAAAALEWLAREYEAQGDYEDALKRTRRPTEANYRRSVVQSRKTVRKWLKEAKAGEISIERALSNVWDRIEAQHVTSAVLGRQRAGDLADADGVDELFGRAKADADYKFFNKFSADVRAGRYGKGPELNLDRVFARASMYLDKSRSTANEAFALASPIGTLFEWVMLAAEHCKVCPSRAVNGPYTYRTMPGWPADGSTPCLTNCHCVVVREDGVVGFARVNYDGSSGGTHQVAISGENTYGPASYRVNPIS